MDEEERVVVAVLAARVSDGTRCRPGSLDMCIDGRCQVSLKYFLRTFYSIRSAWKNFIFFKLLSQGN